MAEFKTVSAALFGFGLVRRDPLTFVGVTILLSLVGLATFLILLPPYADLIEMSLDTSVSPDDQLTASMAFFSSIGGFMLVAVVMWIIVQGALLRSLVFDGHRGWVLGLQLGAAELWSFLTTLVVYILSFLVYILGAVAAGVAAGVLGAAQAPETVAIAVAAGLVALGLFLMVWLGVRLTPASAQAAAERRLVVGSAWSMTKGKAWSIFWSYVFLYLLVVIVTLVVLFVAGTVVGAGMGGMVGAENGPEQEMAALLEGMRALKFGPGVVIGSVVYGLFYATIYAAWYGIGAYAYRQLRPEPAAGPAGGDVGAA